MPLAFLILLFYFVLCLDAVSLPPRPPGVAQVVLVNSYPELRVNGRPFFIHSAAFFYYRTPRERWESFLRRYHALGINTVDLYVPWNWHEPAEGALDFTGRTHPQRDIAGLLRLVEELGLKVVLRPGPVILNEWRNGGYPGWLLSRPEYNMALVDLLEGRYPPMSNLAPRNSEEASRGWLENATHMKSTRDWLQAVARDLIAPHKRAILFVQLDDDQALGRTNYSGSVFWRYMHALREMLAAGGNDRPVFINPTDMRVSAAGWEPSFPTPIAAMGQWYQPAARPEQEAGAAAGLPLKPDDYAEMEFFTDTLKTQPRFPAMIIEFQAGWYCPADDTAPRASHPANTLLAGRTLWADGLRGLNYFPLQDTMYPAGYEVPWANRHYNWNAALDVDGNEREKVWAVRRNGNLIAGLGAQLAATHKWADVGIIYPLGAYPQEKLQAADIRRISGDAIRLQQELRRRGVASDLVDPYYQTVEQLRRYRLLLFKEDPQFRLSARAVRAMKESGVAVAAELPSTAGRIVEAPESIYATAERSNSPPGYAFVFVTNPNYQAHRRVELRVRDPRNPSGKIALPAFTLGAHDSLALPVRLPICDSGKGSGADCGDELYYATAELVRFRRQGARVELRFYVPRDAEARLRRARRLSRGRAQQDFTVKIPAGRPPDFLRTLTLSLERTVGGGQTSADALAGIRPAPRAGSGQQEAAGGKSSESTPEAIPPVHNQDEEVVLDNGRLRVVFTPAAGGRAFVVERAGRNATTTVGFFRDRFLKYEQPPNSNPRRLRGAFGLHNRPYSAQKAGDTLRLEYTAPDVWPRGARIVKTFRLPEGKDYVLADYEIEFLGGPTEQSFVSVNSVPWLESRAAQNWLTAREGEQLFMLFWEEESGGKGVAERRNFSSLWTVAFPPPGRVLQRLRMACWYGPGEEAAAAEEMKRALAAWRR